MINDYEPRTWCCECGQINLYSDRKCRACKGAREEVWDEWDRHSRLFGVEKEEYDKGDE